ncbi:hypothetical protein LIER_23557 [Lithospermum erythrorhizon]|uniref:Uncharacterized protein n=1 Tax=Lithospermum erythrorhizon TaxID=34254 RepID=A0AAV3QZG9_LITER
MATSISPISLSGCTHANRLEFRSLRSALVNPSRLSVRKSNCQGPKRNAIVVRAEYNDHRGGTGGDFVAGFLVGGALFGALGYVFAPQIRKSLLNEDEYGFRKAKRPIYYEEGLEVTWQNLNKKISQLNSAIDNVSSRLRGRNKMPPVPVETDPEEATM